ncbi:hypothetical protein JCM8547_001021 [Rhodosporidiobolus lusitaniae]
MRTPVELAEQQQRDKQSKALGAAFLAHQVSQLEGQVDQLAFSRGHAGGSRGGRGGRGAGGRGGGAGAGLARPAGRKRETRVVDASVLVHALPLLKRWVREDQYLLVVPLSALSTLDALKRGPPHLSDAARLATLFLETQLNIARQLSAAFPPAEADVRIRLRAQRAREEVSWSEVERMWEVPEEWEVKLPEGVNLPKQDLEEGEEPKSLPLPTAGDIPRHLRSTLQCVLYFHQLASSSHSSQSSASRKPPPPSSPSPVGVVYNNLLPVPPPLHHSLARLVQQQTSLHSSPRKSSTPSIPKTSEEEFLSLSSGDSLTYYLSTFFPSLSSPSLITDSPSPPSSLPSSSTPLLEAIPCTAVVAAQAWLKIQAVAQQAARERERDGAGGGDRGGRGGGGGGRGGRGGGRGKGERVGGRGGQGGGQKEGGGAGGGGGGKTLFVP